VVAPKERCQEGAAERSGLRATSASSRSAAAAWSGWSGVTYRHGKLKRYSPEHHRVRIADPSGGPCRCSRSGSGSVRSWRRTRSRSMTPTFTSATSTAYAARADRCDRGQWGEHGSLNGRNVKASLPCTRKSKDHSRGNTWIQTLCASEYLGGGGICNRHNSWKPAL
jgi:hypothetical protein